MSKQKPRIPIRVLSQQSNVDNLIKTVVEVLKDAGYSENKVKMFQAEIVKGDISPFDVLLKWVDLDFSQIDDISDIPEIDVFRFNRRLIEDRWRQLMAKNHRIDDIATGVFRVISERAKIEKIKPEEITCSTCPFYLAEPDSWNRVGCKLEHEESNSHECSTFIKRLNSMRSLPHSWCHRHPLWKKMKDSKV